MKRPVIITIGYSQFLLSDDVGVATIVKTLSKAVECRYYSGGDVKLSESLSLEVSMQYLPRGAQIVQHDGSPLPSKPKPQPNHGARKLKSQHVRELPWNNQQRLI